MLLLGIRARKPHGLRFWLLPSLLDLAKKADWFPGNLVSLTATTGGQRSNPEVVPRESYLPTGETQGDNFPLPPLFQGLLQAHSLWISSLKTSYVAKQTHLWTHRPWVFRAVCENIPGITYHSSLTLHFSLTIIALRWHFLSKAPASGCILRNSGFLVLFSLSYVFISLFLICDQ